MKPLVSVIIPNYNYEKFIAKTIESVLSQTYENLEIIVVDDGSKDKSLEVLENFGDQIILIHQQNAGVSVARNNGVEHSNGEFIAFLDADDIWLPEKIERQLEKFETAADIGLVHCSMKLVDLNDNLIGEISDGMEGSVAKEFLRFNKGVVVGAGSTGIVKREIFDEVGGFDKRLSTAADWDFCYRIATKYKIGFIKEPYVLYRMHGSNMHSDIRAMENDVLIGFEKAFSEPLAFDLLAIKNYCYGRMHRLLAGSYFQSRLYTASVRNLIKSLWYDPKLFFGYLGIKR